jgi:hypothetical protein
MFVVILFTFLVHFFTAGTCGITPKLRTSLHVILVVGCINNDDGCNINDDVKVALVIRLLLLSLIVGLGNYVLLLFLEIFPFYK